MYTRKKYDRADFKTKVFLFVLQMCTTLILVVVITEAFKLNSLSNLKQDARTISLYKRTKRSRLVTYPSKG